MPEIDPFLNLERLHKYGPQYAQAKAERIYMEEMRKTIKAQLMKSCGLEAIGAQEREAYAHPDYKQHLEALKEAIQAEESLRWKMVTAQVALDVWRSKEASNRMMDRNTA